MQIALLSALVSALMFTSDPVISQVNHLDQKYRLASTTRNLIWKANYLLGGGHDGTLGIESAQLLLSPEGKIVKAEFTIDMNSLRNTDQKDEKSRKDLEEHLKSDDFFSTSRFPKAFFSTTAITPKTATDLVTKGFTKDSSDHFSVTGYLAIKGVINAVTFPAAIHQEGKTIRVKAEISIDRTKWGITYQSKSIFSDLKDGVIEDQIKVLVDLEFIQSE